MSKRKVTGLIGDEVLARPRKDVERPRGTGKSKSLGRGVMGRSENKGEEGAQKKTVTSSIYEGGLERKKNKAGDKNAKRGGKAERTTPLKVSLIWSAPKQQGY